MDQVRAARPEIKAVIAMKTWKAEAFPTMRSFSLPDNRAPIGENARKILRAMADGVKRER